MMTQPVVVWPGWLKSRQRKGWIGRQIGDKLAPNWHIGSAPKPTPPCEKYDTVTELFGDNESARQI